MTTLKSFGTWAAALLVAGCGAADETGTAEPVSPEKSDPPTLADSLGAREGAAADVAPERDARAREALRAAGLDPDAVRAEAEAIARLEDPQQRAEERAAFVGKYQAFFAAPSTPNEISEGSAHSEPSHGGERVETVSSELLRPTSLTRCSTQPTIFPPFEASSPLPPPGSSVSGAFGVRKAVSVGAVDERAIHTIRDTIEVSTPAEVKVKVSATVRIDAAVAEAYTILFGYASSGATLNLRVLDGTRVVCSKEDVLVQATYAERRDATPGERVLECEFNRARNGSRSFSVELAAGAWASAGGSAWSDASARGSLLRIQSSTCVEPGIMIDGRGLCVKPFSSPAVDFSQTKIDECLGGSDEKWSHSASTRRITHLASGLCLEAFAPVTSGGYVVMLPCSATKPTQQWTRRANGQLVSASIPAFCLEGSGATAGSRIQSGLCSAAATPPASQAFRFH